jgi:hypothetical protein
MNEGKEDTKTLLFSILFFVTLDACFSKHQPMIKWKAGCGGTGCEIAKKLTQPIAHHQNPNNDTNHNPNLWFAPIKRLKSLILALKKRRIAAGVLPLGILNYTLGNSFDHVSTTITSNAATEFHYTLGHSFDHVSTNIPSNSATDFINNTVRLQASDPIRSEAKWLIGMGLAATCLMGLMVYRQSKKNDPTITEDLPMNNQSCDRKNKSDDSNWYIEIRPERIQNKVTMNQEDSKTLHENNSTYTQQFVF